MYFYGINNYRSLAKMMREKAGRSIIQPGFSEHLTLRNKELVDLFEFREICVKEKGKKEAEEGSNLDEKKTGV